MMGSISGDVLDALGFTAADTLDALETFRANDAGTEYRLIAGHLNLAVIAGDFVVAPTPLSSGGDVVAKAQFNFWGT
jgi:hypothetical protein